MSALDRHRLAASEAVQEAAELLSQILAQDITDPEESDSEESDPGESDSSEDGPSGSVPSEATGPEATDPEATGSEENGVEEGPQIREGVATDRIISTVDPEMRHGRKSSSTHFDGYKVHITEAVESEFITGVAVTPGNQHDSDVAEELAEQVEERFGQSPSVLIGDSHYGSPDLRVVLKEAFQDQEDENQEGEDQKVKVVAKLPTATGGNGDRFDKTDFEIDPEEGHVTCPAGHRTETSYQSRDHKDRPVERFQFDGEVCAECPLRSECTTAKNGRTTCASLPRGPRPRGAGLQRNRGV